MSAYSGTPTVNGIWETGDRFGKRIRVHKRLTITLSSQGGGTNTIGYAALGFASGGIQYVHCVLFVDGSSNNRQIALFTDGNNVYTADPSVATDANRGLAADVTGTLTFEIAGLPA